MAKRKLSQEAITYILQALACFDTPSEVAEVVNKEFGIKIAKQSVEKYDPTKQAGKNLALKWKKIFEDSRKAFVDKIMSIPIAHRSVRLRAIGRMAEAAERQKNYALAAQLLEQAAKEVGEVYTNKRQITGANGGSIRTVNKTQVSLSETDAELVKRFLG